MHAIICADIRIYVCASDNAYAITLTFKGTQTYPPITPPNQNINHINRFFNLSLCLVIA